MRADCHVMPRILIIEDTPANLQLTLAILEGAGHTTLSAPTAEQGLRMASAEPVELILMDMRLPGIDGMTATRLLKEDPRTRHIPIIALTASAMKGDEQRMRARHQDRAGTGRRAPPLRGLPRQPARPDRLGREQPASLAATRAGIPRTRLDAPAEIRHPPARLGRWGLRGALLELPELARAGRARHPAPDHPPRRGRDRVRSPAPAWCRAGQGHTGAARRDRARRSRGLRAGGTGGQGQRATAGPQHRLA